uniref:Uncharacterized protein n=1 Tax=Geladintestivirus 1 TaxID=3233133 RepID=A0AAU8MLG4_9CAUD
MKKLLFIALSLIFLDVILLNIKAKTQTENEKLALQIDSLKQEKERYRQLSICLGNMVRDYYFYRDFDKDDLSRKTNVGVFFDDVICETPYYIMTDSLLNGDWSNFFDNDDKSWKLK